MGENLPENVALSLMAEKVIPFFGIDEALTAVETAAFISAAWRKPQPAPLLSSAASCGEIHTLYEDEAKAELAAFGVPVPKGAKAATPDEAADVATSVGFPVALKGLGIAHKTEAGAVKLNLKTADEVREAARQMASIATGFLIEKMVSKPVAEIIIGATRDAVAGLVLTIGAGGILVELLEDAVTLTLPTDPETIRESINGLKIAKLLRGYRGNPPGDIDALVKTVASVAQYVATNATTLEELDLNPLMVLPEGDGVVVVDALIRKRN